VNTTHTEAREAMVERLRRRGYVDDDRVAEALRSVPRHEFVPEGQRSNAYADRPLSIGSDQTVSAPHMVGMMTELLDPALDDRVLEVGTGCGYHAAVTAETVPEGHVYSVEYVQGLVDRARETLSRLGYDIRVRTGDGHEGWPEHAPYDAAYLTCAPEEVPDPIVEQVRAGGRILAPVGSVRQELVLLRVRSGGDTERETFAGVRFVPMQGG